MAVAAVVTTPGVAVLVTNPGVTVLVAIVVTEHVAEASQDLLVVIVELARSRRRFGAKRRKVTALGIEASRLKPTH